MTFHDVCTTLHVYGCAFGLTGSSYGAIMATLEAIPGIESFVHQKVEVEHKTHEHVSSLLQSRYPLMKGLGSRSIRRFCCSHNIHATSRLTALNNITLPESYG